MIPFIDVSLVLLIIFMIMTPFLVKEQIKINLPTTKTSTPVESQELVQIDVPRDGDIRVDGVSVKDDEVEEALRKSLKDPENQPVVIAADRDVSFEKVVVAMDAAKTCGAKKMGVSVKRLDGTREAAQEAPAQPSKQRSPEAVSEPKEPKKTRTSPAAAAKSKSQATQPSRTTGSGSGKTGSGTAARPKTGKR